MNRKGVDLLANEVIYIILFALAISLSFALIYKYTNNASSVQDYYSKEIARVIDSSVPGDNISLNIDKAVSVAEKNGISISSGNSFKFDSANHRVCVLLSKGNPSCYSYFNDVSVVLPDNSIDLGNPDNWIHFSIVSSSGGVK